jgi:class 3 adenylate cyclase/tetratricopeptide (TPR) repeat protein/ketosteroid isomerase-like protein
MSCARCGRTNPAVARFCAGCGNPLAPGCPACGAENEDDARFCIACGTALAARPAPAARTPAPHGTEARKVVTVVFADLVGSTALHERLDPESVSRFMDDYYRAVRAPIEAHGGSVIQLLGDGVLCAFGVPRVAEDDAIRAVRAAVALQRAFGEFAGGRRELAGAVGLRVAVNTGEVVVSDEHPAGIGDPLNVAARLQQEAREGEVLIGEATARLVRSRVTLEPVGTVTLKGRSETVTAYRVVSLDRPAGMPATAFVGREDELRRLAAVYDAATTARAVRLAVILGSPGLGKSRLLDELGRRLQEGATVLGARCDATGAATFAPIAEGLRAFLHPGAGADADDAIPAAIAAALAGDADRDRIAAGIASLLAGTPAPPEETFFVVRRFLAALAATRPVVLAIDDLQWAEPLLLDLIEHLVQWGTGLPLLVLGAARPELRDVRSSLVTPGALVAEVVTLAGLDAAAATRLAANVIGAEALPAAVAGRVLATSEGNPLFVGELVRMLVHDGALRREGDRWTTAVELAHLEMPPTIHALLAARIERLRPEDRTVLERAAVIGRRFSRAAVAHLLPREITDLDARLEALRRSELIEPDTAWFLGEPALRFHHGLTRDAAYRRVLKGTRAELHGRFAKWLEARVGVSVEHDETIGWHLEQAHQHLRELGPIDEHGRALGERAARYLAAAGRRALARDDLLPAANLLGRALDRLDAADPGRADLALDWCEALLAAGDVGPAAKAIAELGRFAVAPPPAAVGLRGYGVAASGVTNDRDLTSNPLTPNPRLQAWHTCFAGQLAVLTDPQALRATAEAVAAAADELAAAGDDAGEAKAHSVHAEALSRLGQVGASEAALDRALAAARRAGDRRRANAVLAGAPLAALWGPSPVTRASGRCLDVVRVLRITQGAPAVEAVALRCQGVIEALRGRGDAARRMIASSRRMVEELGLTQGLFETEVSAGLVELIEGDDAAAEQRLRAAYEGFRDHGLGIDAARAAALLGRSLLPQGRAAEAEALSHESEALAGDDLQAAITWRRVRAEALAQRGEHAAAVDYARAAVDIAAATDALIHHADARQALAAALRAAGRHDQAAAEEARAIELWEAKGATVLAERARRRAPRLDAVVTRVDSREGEPFGEPSARRSGSAGASPSLSEPRTRRRVRPNAASAATARLEAAFRARDLGAVEALCGDRMETVDHPNGATYGRAGEIESSRRMMRLPSLEFRMEVLATLGDSLCLVRRVVAASGTAGGSFDVADYEMEHLAVCEVDEEGRCGRFEVFAPDHLGDAVARLYERYAERLPEGPERHRAAATARSVAATGKMSDLERFATAIAPDVEAVDHRTVGFGTVRGAEVALATFRALLELSETVTFRLEDVLALCADALLVRGTNTGRLRVGGGAFERSVCALLVFGGDGRITRWEQFDAGHDAEALARFDELTAEPWALRVAAAPSRVAKTRARRVRPNAATAQAARVDAAIAAHDADALPALFADESKVVDHITGVDFDREGILVTWRGLLKAEHPTAASEPLATLGDSLVLCRLSTSASGFVGRTFDVGAYEQVEIGLIEVDAQGRMRRRERFAPDRLGDAVVRLYERYAELLPDGPERARAEATARSVAVYVGPEDLDRYATTLAPHIDYVDHRIIAMESTQGAETFLRVLRSLHEVADEVANRVDDVLALRPDAGLLRVTNFGRDRAGGGTYERPFLALSVFGPDGLLTRFEQFDVGHEAEALARFDELCPSDAGETAGSRTVRFENAATRAFERGFEALQARDWERFAALFAPGFRGIDRRRMLRNELDRDEWLVSYRPIVEMTSPRSTHQVLATRGDRLMLARYGWEGTDGLVGPSEIEYLLLVEVDGRGDHVAVVMFDPDDLDAAHAELDERYAKGETAPHARAWEAWVGVVRAIAARDWERLAAAFAPGFVVEDHRPLALLASLSGDEYASSARALVDLRRDVRFRVHHALALDDGASLGVAGWVGSEPDGTFETLAVVVTEHGLDGIRRWHVYDLDQLDAARTCYDALTAKSPPPRIENAATRVEDRLLDAWAARDWERFAALFPPGVRLIDRRRMVQLEIDRERFLESFRPIVLMTSSVTSKVLATRGDRLALTRTTWTGADGDRGPSEIELLRLLEMDGGGEPPAAVAFDPDDLDAAYAELDARYAAGEAAPYARIWETYLRVGPAVDARDWQRLASVFAPDFVMEDHRVLGFLPCSRDVYVASVRALLDLRPDTRFRVDHALALDERRSLTVMRWEGAERDGTFEIAGVTVCEHALDGTRRRQHVWDLDQLDAARACYDALGATVPSPRIDPEQLDQARARFAALGESGPAEDAPRGRPDAARDPLAALAKPNAATVARDRLDAAFEARDWAALRALCVADATFEDRRRHVLVSHGVDEWIADRQRWARAAVHQERRLVATAGDRIALDRVLATSGPPGGRSEFESLQLAEVDEGGRILAQVAFDPDDRRAANAEALARALAHDPAAATLRPVYEATLGLNDHDLARVRAALADDLVVHDHRLAGLGLVEGADAYLESLEALWRLVPDEHIEGLFELARERYGVVLAGRAVGTLPEGGAVERPIVAVSIVAGGRVARVELFEPEDVDAALARFVELRPDPLRIPPNAATHADDRAWECIERRDWEALRALCAPIVWEDHRRLIRTTGDCDALVANAKLMSRSRTRVSRTTLATAGDRLVLQRIRYTGPPEGPSHEIEHLELTEVDAEGHIVALIDFDPDDCRAASAEMLERHARSAAGRCIPAAVFETFRAINDHDLDRLRASLPDDFVYHDHRRTGLGRLEGVEDYVASLRPLFEETRDFSTDNLYYVAAETHGSLAVARTFGTLAADGELESVFARLLLYRDGRIGAVEQFELEHLDVARARFEELRPGAFPSVSSAGNDGGDAP